MTYPQYDQQQMPGFPQAPASAPPQGYPQQYPQQYGAPQGYPQPGFPQQPPQYGAPQGYPQGQQPAPQLATGSLDAFYQQPSVGGGAALSFDVNTTHIGIVARPVTDADIQQQTQRGSGLPATYKDGRPKFVMKVPMLVQPSPKHPDGTAQWWCSGSARDELVRAMAEVGAPAGPPEAGATIQITCTGERQIPGMNPAKTYRVIYQRPNAAALPAPAPVPAAQPAPVPQAAPVQQVPAPVAAPVAPAANVTPLVPAAAGNLNEAQLQLLAQLTNQQPSQQAA